MSAGKTFVSQRREAGVVTLTIDRPEALNALNGEVLKALDAAVTEVEAEANSGEDAVRAVIVTGAGDKAFVAGADIKAMAALSSAEALAFTQLGHRVFAALEALPVPVLAAVNGFALGGGCELALCADVIYASDKAKFGQPEVNLGLIPGFGGCVRLGRRIGWQRAAELIYSGETVGAAEAMAIGLVAKVFAPNELLDRVTAIAHKMASRGPLAVRAAKHVLHRAQETDSTTAAAAEQHAFAALFSSADQREGCAAFLEKRLAHFTGR